MLGKITWWDKEAKMGAVTDVEGKEWKIFDDMVDDDSMKAKMKEGLVINFEANPSLDGSAMRIDVANQEDQKQFSDDFKALLRAVEEKLPNTGLEGWCPSLIEEKQVKKLTEAEAMPDLKSIADKSPKDIRDFVDLIIDYNSSDLESVKETLEDDDAFHEMADGYIDQATSVLWKWYGEDPSRGQYIDAAVDEGLVDFSTLKKGIEQLLMVGQYAYNAEKLQEAKTWLEEFISDLPEVTEESVKKKLKESESDGLEDYLEAALWSSTDDNGKPLDDNYSQTDFSDEAMKQATKDWHEFQKQAGDLLSSLDISHVAHDFWLTRNRHGAGFWDGDYEEAIGKKLTDLSHGFGETDLYVGDDGKLYFSR